MYSESNHLWSLLEEFLFCSVVQSCGDKSVDYSINRILIGNFFGNWLIVQVIYIQSKMSNILCIQLLKYGYLVGYIFCFKIIVNININNMGFWLVGQNKIFGDLKCDGHLTIFWAAVAQEIEQIVL